LGENASITPPGAATQAFLGVPQPAVRVAVLFSVRMQERLQFLIAPVFKSIGRSAYIGPRMTHEKPNR